MRILIFQPHVRLNVKLRHQLQYPIYRSFFNSVDRNWETAWKQRLTPWETKTSAPPLRELFESHNLQLLRNPNLKDRLHQKRALVPGCGSGYDVLYLKQLGFGEVVG